MKNTLLWYFRRSESTLTDQTAIHSAVRLLDLVEYNFDRVRQNPRLGGENCYPEMTNQYLLGIFSCLYLLLLCYNPNYVPIFVPQNISLTIKILSK